MQTSLVLQTPLMQKLARATKPEQTKEVESIAAAGRAWAKENDDYEAFVQATYEYILARRKTTELVQPFIQNFHGNQHVGVDNDVKSLSDMGFTYKQWNRRTKELEMALDEINAYFDECLQNGWHPSLAGMMKYVSPLVAYNSSERRREEAEKLAKQTDKYPVILADPAWEYDFSRSDNRKIENHYPPSPLEDMKQLVPPATTDAVLFMWATSPKLREALELMEAWGFEYKTHMVWVKDRIGMGYYARQKHELLLIGTKGEGLELPDPSIRPESVFFAPRGRHSEKPEEAYEIIEAMYPPYKKFEMFARKARAGWEVWGDET